MELFTFAYFSRFEDSLRFLAENLAKREIWSYSNPAKELAEGNNAARFKFPILRNYLEHTFRKIKAESKIVYTQDNQFACFNTGLVTPNLEEIYAFFEENRSVNKQSPYFFRAFIKQSDREFLTLFSDNIPDVANYFTEPHKLIFNPRLKLIPDIDHIILDSKFRFPDPLKQASDREVRGRLIGAIDEISKLAKINYRMAIPQYYDNKFQLLLPLKLVDETNADLAIVVEQINDKTYSAQACLTIGMAYNNARLIVCPQSDWLKP